MTTGRPAPDPLIEVCVEGIDGVMAAQDGGADRIELCASLLEGGVTPSHGTIRAALGVARVPIHVIVRPRGGDFLYSAAEFASMGDDIANCRDAGVAGIVIGCLRADGTVDEARTRALVKASRPLSVTFHRAFDMARDPFEALDALVRCGVDRVLTSGQRDRAIDATDLLRRLNAAAAARIVVMGCGELDPDTIGAVRRKTGLRELHFAALSTVPSAMTYRNPHVGMGGTAKDREYSITLTDPERVRATISAARCATAAQAP